MASIQIIIKDVNYQPALDAIAAMHGWTATIEQPSAADPFIMETVPNPLTKEQFFKKWLKGKVRNELIEYRNRTALAGVSVEADI